MATPLDHALVEALHMHGHVLLPDRVRDLPPEEKDLHAAKEDRSVVEEDDATTTDADQ